MNDKNISEAELLQEVSEKINIWYKEYRVHHKEIMDALPEDEYFYETNPDGSVMELPKAKSPDIHQGIDAS